MSCQAVLFGKSVSLGEDLVAILGIARSDISGERDMRPLENVQIGLRKVHPSHLRALAVGSYPSVRTLGLGLAEVPAFLRALAESRCSVDKPVLEALDVCLHLKQREAAAGRQGLELLGESIEKGRLGFIRKIKIRGEGAMPALAEARERFFQALSNKQLPRLSVLSLVDLRLVRLEVNFLVEALRKGNLPRLRVLDLPGNESQYERAVGGSEMRNLMRAVVESEGSLHDLEELNLSGTNAGMGAGGLGRALRSGNLRRLSVVNLSRSRLSTTAVRSLAEAVRDGALVALSSLNLKENFYRSCMLKGYAIGEYVEPAGWTELLQNEDGLPSLKRLDLVGTNAQEAGPAGRLATVLGTGKLLSLECLRPNFFQDPTEPFELDDGGVQRLSDAVRAGRFPPGLCLLGFRLVRGVQGIDVDRLISAIAESEKGLPLCIASLNLLGGRLREDSLMKLARSGRGSSGSRLSNLKDLALCDCEIDDHRLKRLAEVFCAHGCPRLTLLNLFLNKISPEGLKAFVDALSPEALPCLIDLSVGGQQGFEGRDSEEEKRFARHIESLKERVRSEGKLKSLRIFR
uniref:Uncharacterized protein n=1 Tax=Chromera velia CCMP2878 TaxID=1169474 RepID=A0A0G4HAV4_9ALVE|eukprot:Cvel_6127.t1-p1 / transcript=Cvel_6127.t1 / gene=Cvel_6127 / organism=Chromera_velia_CCMP2878 / gene_product=hypothetical protein / transcript_product=hypothetical protein / location=Cvel_scaffold296:8307-10313(+) / protein_length=573 / sequence_SO=supercontig / SO=protein_coding / is_pseudo=false